MAIFLTKIIEKIIAGVFKPDNGRTLTLNDENTGTTIATGVETPANSGQFIFTRNATPNYMLFKLDGVTKTNYGRIWGGTEVGSQNMPGLFYVSKSLGVNVLSPTDAFHVSGTSTLVGNTSVSGTVTTQPGTGIITAGGRVYGTAGVYGTSDTTTLTSDIITAWLGAKWSYNGHNGLALHGAPGQAANYIQITSNTGSSAGDVFALAANGDITVPSGALSIRLVTGANDIFIQGSGSSGIVYLGVSGSTGGPYSNNGFVQLGSTVFNDPAFTDFYGMRVVGGGILEWVSDPLGSPSSVLQLDGAVLKVDTLASLGSFISVNSTLRPNNTASFSGVIDASTTKKLYFKYGLVVSASA